MVPVKEEKFDLDDFIDDFIDYIIEFLTFLGPNLHIIAICQPTVPLLAAITIMSKNNDVNISTTMTLIGSSIDARLNTTGIYTLAVDKSMD